MSRSQEFIGVRTIEAANAYGEGQHLYNMYLTDTEIIRCRDCKHFAGAVFGRSGYWCNLLEVGVKPDGFCAWAERDA